MTRNYWQPLAYQNYGTSPKSTGVTSLRAVNQPVPSKNDWNDAGLQTGAKIPRAQSDTMGTTLASPNNTTSGGFNFSMPSFKPPEIPTLSLDEMMDIVNRRVDLLINPRLESTRRQLEEEKVAGERVKGDIQAGWKDAKENVKKTGEEYQREGSSTMRKRGIYDSGMAVELSNQIQRTMMDQGAKVDTEQARALGDLAEYLLLRERHTNEEINELMGQKGEWAASLLDEMHSKERDRKDRLEQQHFENWLQQQAMAFEIARANRPSGPQGPQGPNYSDLMTQMKFEALQKFQKFGMRGLSEHDRYMLGWDPFSTQSSGNYSGVLGGMRQ